MSRKRWGIFAVVVTLVAMAAWTTPASAQDEPKEKPPMYSYVAFWNIPRAQWADMDKNNAADQKTLDKALADGAIVAYGNDLNLVHEVDGMTHDGWWSAMSMAAMLNVLDKFYKSGTATSPVLASATRHSDGIFVSRYYNWRPGSYKNAYTRVGMYKLKPDVPERALEMLSKSFIVPILEKLLADGSIAEYEIDTEAIHTQAPGTFWIDVISPNADGLDKLNAALRDSSKTSPLNGAAFTSMVDEAAHRDNLASSTVTYK
ncbi:MAG: hypothetical protein ACRD3H_15645 [Terriglobales bacterium]